MSTINQKGLGQLSLILLLLAGIGLGTYLVQQRTNILPFAAEGCGVPQKEGVTEEGNLETMTPVDQPSSVDQGLTAARIVNRKQDSYSDGGYIIYYKWSDGRESWDIKDPSGRLQDSRACRDGKKSIKSSEESIQGKTEPGYFKSVWTDGTTEYNYFELRDGDLRFNPNKTYSTYKASGTAASPTGSPSSTSPSSSTSPASSTAIKKSDVTGFRDRFNQIDSKLEEKSDVINLRIVLGIANNDLNDLANSNSIDRARFDLSKTAARLAAFYGIFNGVKGVCAKVDFGLDPLITAKAKSSTATDGRVNLCSSSSGTKVWRVLDNSFRQLEIDSSDTRWKANPKCEDLPATVRDHLRKAEKLFENEEGFVKNSPCTGK